MAAAFDARQREIVELVRRQGFVTIDDLAQRFRVTTQTIRRDVNLLSREGLLRRYHGGAGLPSRVENIAYTTRQILCHAEKQRIGRLLAQHIPDDASLFINIGTTTEEVAKALVHHRGLHVVTNNLNVATIMSSNPEFEVIVAGGMVRSRDRGVVGAAAVDLIRQFRVDFGIIGISGIDEDGSLLDFDYREVRVAQAIMENSDKVLLAADHSKFGRKAVVRLAKLSQVSALFTDSQPPSPWAELIASADVDLHVAPPETASMASA